MGKKKILLLLLFILTTIVSCNQERVHTMDKILVITGGHDFESSFYEIFESFNMVIYDTITQPQFNRKLKSGIADHYDVLVFYDMWQDINADEKDAFLSLLDEGKGMVFLHHTLASYQHWGEFEKIIGGKYVEKEAYDDPGIKRSTYTHDILLDIKVIDRKHPVTKEISDFSIFDEGYQYIQMISSIKPLLSTSHHKCTPTVGWTNQYGKSRIVYLLFGHGRQAHDNKNYRLLLRNAIKWVAKEK